MLMVEPSGRTSKTGYCLSYLFLVHRTTEVLFDVWWTPVVCNPDATTACLCSEFCRHLGEMNSEIRQWWDACLCDHIHIQHGKHSNSSHQWQGGISSDTTACLCTKYCTSTELKRQFILLIFCRNCCWTTHAVQSTFVHTVHMTNCTCNLTFALPTLQLCLLHLCIQLITLNIIFFYNYIWYIYLHYK